MQKKTGMCLSDVYEQLGCSKYDLVHWEEKPYFVEVKCNEKKLTVIRNAAELFGLTASQSEKLANRAGLSLSPPTNLLQKILSAYRGRQHLIFARANISERMFRHYASGVIPTKQALLAISITLNPSLQFVDRLLKSCGYCLSKSIPSDCITLWYLTNRFDYGNHILDSINNTLDNLGLPLLMTRPK